VAEDAFEAGALDYLVKNLPLGEFKKKILKYLEN